MKKVKKTKGKDKEEVRLFLTLSTVQRDELTSLSSPDRSWRRTTSSCPSSSSVLSGLRSTRLLVRLFLPSSPKKAS